MKTGHRPRPPPSSPTTEAERSQHRVATNGTVEAEAAERRRIEEALRASEARYRAVVESQTDLICRYLPDTTLTFVNEAYCRYFGRTRAELLGRPFLELIPEPSRAAAREHVESLVRRPRVVVYEHEALLPDGSVGWQQWTDHVVVDARGNVLELQGIGRDVTERRRAEEALRSAQYLLQSTIDALTAHVAILDECSNILAVNAAWRRFARRQTRRPAVGVVGASYLAACDAAARNGSLAAGETAAGVRAVLAGTQETFCQVYGRPDGDRLAWFQLRVTRFSQGGTLRLVVAREDVTDLKQAEAQLEQLASRLLRLQDEERRRIARELHDGMGQNLFALTMSLARLQALASDQAPEFQQLLAESSALAEQSLQDTRTLSYLLHPPLLDEMGLVPALQWYVEGFGARSGIRVALVAGEEIGRLPTDVETALFRVVQESLTNIHRHSGSATAHVRLTRDARRVLLQVQDQGSGITASPRGSVGNLSSLGVGIPGMRQRLRQLGGRLDVRSAGGGTTITATVPVKVEGPT